MLTQPCLNDKFYILFFVGLLNYMRLTKHMHTYLYFT